MTPIELEPFVALCCGLSTDDMFAALVASEYGFQLIDHGTEPGFRGPIRNRYAYRPGTTPESPLLVCHADTVKPIPNYAYNPETGRVCSLGLDDRLGIALLLYGLFYGDLTDYAILICDNEEIGDTTAKQFADDLDKAPFCNPNLMIEFDRRGTDVVSYCYEDDTLNSLLRSVGFDIGTGSFSDISSLESLGVKGFNVGVGYHREHSVECYATLTDTISQYRKALQFLAEYGHIRFEHCPRRSSSRYDRLDDWTDYRVTSKPTVATIPLADNPGDDWDDIVDDGWYVCDHCGFHCSDNDDGCNEYSGGLVCDCCLNTLGKYSGGKR